MPREEPADTHRDDNDGSVTFNVVFTRGTVTRLLPFAVSLLQSPDIRLRLVANGCEAGEIEPMQAVAAAEERISQHALPYARPVEHGVVLNDLFKAFSEDPFAFVDSDVIATGDFMASLGPIAPGQAGVFAAPPVWMTEVERDPPPTYTVLNARRRRLPDGSYVGNTYFAVYDRSALEPAWRASPLGFCGHRSRQIPRPVRRWLAERGWRIRWLDTGRLVNLQLVRAGYELEHRTVPELHHVGGLSLRKFHGWAGGMRRATEMVRASPDGRRFRRLGDGLATRLYSRFLRHTENEFVRGRRSEALAYFDGVLDAIINGAPRPPALTTGSPEMDDRAEGLLAALESQYPAGLAAVREATRHRSATGVR